MANAEQLLHEAQYAFQSISFGESRQNSRNAARAKSLSLKIIRRFPTSMEAGEAHALLRRLGEEAYSSKMTARHRHKKLEAGGKPRATRARQDLYVPPAPGSDIETLNWSGLIGMIVSMPKAILAMTAFGAFFLLTLLTVGLSKKPDSFAATQNLVDAQATSGRTDHQREQRPDKHRFEAWHPNADACRECVVQGEEYSRCRAKACEEPEKY